MKLVINALIWAMLLPSTVWAAPANDNFADRTVLTGTNVTWTGSSAGATKEAGEPYHAEEYGGKSVWWTWTAPISGTVVISTLGSDFDTLLAVYTGSSVSALQVVAFNDDDMELTSAVTFDTAAGRSYQIAVDGYGGDYGNVRLQVKVGPPAPAAQAPPWNLLDPNGTMISSSAFAGKVVLLDFWATWCGPCKAEMPDFVALQDKYRADGLVIIGADVSWSGDSTATVRNFLSTWTPTINYQVVMSTTSIERAFVGAAGIEAVPTTLLIDRQNFIRKKWIGTQSRATFEQQIVPLLYRDTKVSCTTSGGKLTVQWPKTAVPFTLLSCTNPVAGIWTPCATPVLVNGSNTVQMSLEGPATFFRLRLNN